MNVNSNLVMVFDTKSSKRGGKRKTRQTRKTKKRVGKRIKNKVKIRGCNK